MRLTLADALPAIGDSINQNQGGNRVLLYLNQAQKALLDMGRWVGTTIKYRVCVTDNCITWPRELASIEAMSVNGVPSLLQNQWYQFSEYGADFRRSYCGGDWIPDGWGRYSTGLAVDNGEAISMADVVPTSNPKLLKVYARAAEAAGARILLQFYDNQGNYVRSNDSTEGWVDGEFVLLNSTNPQTTVNPVTAWVGVQKPVTNDVVRVTEFDTVTGLERLLAVFQPNETNPSYRRTRIDRYCNGIVPNTVQVIGKQRFIPAIKPRDYLMLQSIGALVNMTMAVYKQANNDPQSAQFYKQEAMNLLDAELAAWIGYGTQQTVHFNSAYSSETGVNNLI